jgi:translocation and assembly module TamA
VTPLARLAGRLVCIYLCLLLALALAGAAEGQAPDRLAYAVKIAPTGNGPLDQAVEGASTLISLRASAPVGPFALIARARSDAARFSAALQSFGYYDGHAEITIAGLPLDDPALPATLGRLPATKTAQVHVSLTLGPLFHLRHIAVQGEVSASARQKLALQPGAPAVAADILAARDRLLAALRSEGHAFAKAPEPIATLIPAERALDVTFPVDAGPAVDLGPITFTGLTHLHEGFVRQRLLLHQGEKFNPETIEAAREDLASVGAISTVRITPADTLDAAGRLPMRVVISERPLRLVQFGAAYSTDLGGSVSASWTHRDLFGSAEQLMLSAAVTELGGTAAVRPGYNLTATLTFPDWMRRNQSLTLSALAVREYLIAYDRTAVVAGAAVSRRLDRDLTAGIGLSAEQAQITQEGITNNYTLLQVPLTLQYDSTHNLLDPTRGVRAALNVTPTQSFATPNATFVIAQASASTYINLGAPGRSVLAMRGLVGTVEGADTFAIPPDQRFYAGGGGTVRGFRYQSIGPQFPDQIPIGGTSVEAGSIEFRQRFGASYGAVAFVDAGAVQAKGVDFSATPQVGAGVGVRYYTSFGPLRLDFALPVTHQPGSDAFELYIGIGQAF